MAARAVPIEVAINRVLASAQELRAATEKAPAPDSFRDELKRAVTTKLASSSSIIAESAPGFGEQIKEAVEKKRGGLPSPKQHKERFERERERYEQQAERGRKWLPATTQAH